MSFLRGSTNYVWCTTSVLGKGATGAVFQVNGLQHLVVVFTFYFLYFEQSSLACDRGEYISHLPFNAGRK